MSRKPGFSVRVALLPALLIGVALLLVEHTSTLCAATQEVGFTEDVLPVFVGRCVGCHQPGGAGFEQSGLDLRTYEGVMKGTKFGPMVIPGDPDTSNLIWLLDWKGSAQLRMPHGKKKLSKCDRDAIREWIRQGAKNN